MSNLPDILRYSSDAEPGYMRELCGSDFSYCDVDGKLLSRGSEVDRIQSLGLPPAYQDVWICKDEFGHLQATGRDEKGRKQYRYHEKWRDFRDHQKFESLANFAEALPSIRSKISRDLRREKPDKIFVCAAIIRLIDKGALRMGNRGYEGESYGASTLRTRHVTVTADGLKLDFKAKGGKRVRKIIRDKTLAKTLDHIDDLPGRHLFQYVNEKGGVSRLDSSDVNAYLPDAFTAKTFRTWHGTLAAFQAARKEKPTIKSLCEAAATRLHNTPAVCRSSYIHPKVITLEEITEPDRLATLSSLTAPAKRGIKLEEQNCLKLISG